MFAVVVEAWRGVGIEGMVEEVVLALEEVGFVALAFWEGARLERARRDGLCGEVERFVVRVTSRLELRRMGN